MYGIVIVHTQLYMKNKWIGAQALSCLLLTFDFCPLPLVLQHWSRIKFGRLALGIGPQPVLFPAHFSGFLVGVTVCVPAPVVVHVPRKRFHALHVSTAPNECMHGYWVLKMYPTFTCIFTQLSVLCRHSVAFPFSVLPVDPSGSCHCPTPSSMPWQQYGEKAGWWWVLLWRLWRVSSEAWGGGRWRGGEDVTYVADSHHLWTEHEIDNDRR